MEKTKIRESFSSAVNTYDKYALIQRICAQKLAQYTTEVSKISVPRNVFEIGCGTGNLTDYLTKMYPATPYHATDISENMLNLCQNKFLGYPNISYSVIDGENVKFDYPQDWIVSNFTFQWFKEQKKCIEHLHSNCNFLIFTTLVEGTFEEWKILCKNFALQSGIIPFISQDELLSFCDNIPFFKRVEFHKHTQHFENPLEFVKSLKKIGASQPKDGYEKQPLREFFSQYFEPLDVSYVVAYCVLSNGTSSS